jgi:hypothetical protein
MGGKGGGPSVPESARRAYRNGERGVGGDFELWGCIASIVFWPALVVVGGLIIWAVALAIRAIA